MVSAKTQVLQYSICCSPSELDISELGISSHPVHWGCNEKYFRTHNSTFVIAMILHKLYIKNILVLLQQGEVDLLLEPTFELIPILGLMSNL